MDALPSGFASKNAKSLSGGPPKSSSITSAIAFAGSGATSSYVRYSSGSKSLRVESILPELDEHRPEFLARQPKMLGPRSIAGLMLDESIVDDDDAMPRQYGTARFLKSQSSWVVFAGLQLCLGRDEVVSELRRVVSLATFHTSRQLRLPYWPGKSCSPGC